MKLEFLQPEIEVLTFRCDTNGTYDSVTMGGTGEDVNDDILK